MIENCVMEGWHPDGYPGNLAYSPELWEWMFDLGLWLNFDPSHLLWIGIDPVEALRPYVDRVIHAHAKDAETFPDERNRYGFFGRTSTREPTRGTWAGGGSASPGLGEVDFPGYVETLRDGGFDGVLSVEHEDPGVGRHAREGRGRARDRPRATCARWWPRDARPGARAGDNRCSRSASLVKEYPGVKALAGRQLRRRSRARSTACSGPTAPASRR